MVVIVCSVPCILALILQGKSMSIWLAMTVSGVCGLYQQRTYSVGVGQEVCLLCVGEILLRLLGVGGKAICFKQEHKNSQPMGSSQERPEHNSTLPTCDAQHIDIERHTVFNSGGRTQPS